MARTWLISMVQGYGGAVGYRLGIDLGTTFTAAAVAGPGPPSLVGLGNRAMQVPSVLFLAEDGEFLVGEPAERRGATEPSRVAREFKRRMGDPVPLLVAGRPFSAETLTARLLRWAVRTATERAGTPPEAVLVSHPANWGPYKRESLAQVITLAEVDGARTCLEPEAAAVQYASRTHVPTGARIAVYDLGGGTFDACVLEKRLAEFVVLGTPDGVDHLGGVDFDDAVFQHVLALCDAPARSLDPDDPATQVALSRLRRDCVEAKEALSLDVAAVVPVALPGLATNVRLVRADLEGLIEHALRETVQAMRRALRSAGVDAEDLAGIVLVGGSSRIPLVRELLDDAFGARTALDAHPKHDVALGAARIGLGPTTLAPSEGTHLGRSRRRRWPGRKASAALAIAATGGLGWLAYGAIGQPGPPPTSDSPEAAVPLRRDLSISSRAHWTDTGLDVRQGDRLRLAASGSISDDRLRPNQRFPPDGAPRDPSVDVHSGDPEPTLPHAALMGRWGPSGRPFYVGRELAIDTSAEPDDVGRLFLGLNDSIVTDNSGAFVVVAELTPAP